MVLWRYGREQGWCNDDVGGEQGWCCDDMGGSRDGAVLIWEKGEQHTFFFCSLNLKHNGRWQCIKKIFTWEQLRTPRAFNNVNPSDSCSTLRKKNQILAIFENRKDLSRPYKGLSGYGIFDVKNQRAILSRVYTLSFIIYIYIYIYIFVRVWPAKIYLINTLCV